MKKEGISDIKFVKRLTTLNMANDIRAWLNVDPKRERQDFADLAGISLRTLESILGYDGTSEEPNWRRSTKDGIMKALGCESFYTPEHKIK